MNALALILAAILGAPMPAAPASVWSPMCGAPPCVAFTDAGVMLRDAPGAPDRRVSDPTALTVIATRLPACESEDGSGQAACVWDASESGNGFGASFVAIRGGTDRGAYQYLSDGHVER